MMTWLAKLKAIWATCSLALILGFCAGWLALHYVGVPFLKPSYSTVSFRLAGYRKLEAEAVDTITQAETLRADENATGVAALSDERESCQATIDAIHAFYQSQFQQLSEGQTYDENNCPVRDVVSARELFGSPAELPPPDPG